MRHLSSGGVGASLWSEVGDGEEAGVTDMVGVSDEEDGRTVEVVARSEAGLTGRLIRLLVETCQEPIDVKTCDLILSRTQVLDCGRRRQF
jgi:hypothetical protein